MADPRKARSGAALAAGAAAGRAGAAAGGAESAVGAGESAADDAAADIDAAQCKAKYDNGVLTLTLPKKQASNAQRLHIE